MSYYQPPQYEYATAPAPPMPHEFAPPASAFSPRGDYYDSQASPLVVSASPAPSVAHSRSSSRHNGEYVIGDRGSYLAPGGYGVVSDRGRVMVEDSGRRSRRQSRGKYYEPKKKYYIDDDAYSNYSTSSYGGESRDHSRSHSRHRRNHSRTPSRESDDSFDERYGVARYRPSRQEEELTSKLKEVQRQLERVQVDAEKKRLEDEQAKMEKLRNQEIEKKVAEQLIVQKKKEEDKARAEKEALEREKKRIAEAAKKLLDEQAAAAAAKKAADAAKKAEIQAIIDQERQKYTAAQSGKKTYTRFSKTHLCKEALEERGIPFTEEASVAGLRGGSKANSIREGRLLPRPPLRREE
jgi:hypothetical protein